MQLSKLTTLLLPTLALLTGTALAIEDEPTTITSTTTIWETVEVTSTTYTATVTIYGKDPKKGSNQGPMLYESMTSGGPNATATGTGGPQPSDEGAAVKFGASLGLASVMGAVVIIAGIL